MTAILQLSNITKSFHQGDTELRVLDGVNLTLEKGTIAALVGPSGSGKTTLLQIAGLLDNPDGGSVKIAVNGSLSRLRERGGVRVSNYESAHADGHPPPSLPPQAGGGAVVSCETLSDSDRTKLRRDHIGFVYQFHHLLPELTAEENVMMPQLIAGKSPSDASKKARELLEMVQLSPRLTHRPGELSGGEQQRVAIARALANDPALILADEPTGNLDPDTSQHVFQVFTQVLKARSAAALIATHNMELAGRMDRILRMNHGKIAIN